MKKNQKYSQEEMYLAIELWQESGLSQSKFCSNEKLSVHTFKYWIKKYRRDKHKQQSSTSSQSFIPVQLTTEEVQDKVKPLAEYISIIYPNGVEIKCSMHIDVARLKTLVSL